MYEYDATVVRVSDVDTLVVEIDLGFRVKLQVRIRVKDLYAPESSTEDGIALADRLRALMHDANGAVVMRTEKLPNALGSYDRYVAEVDLSDGRSLKDVVEAWMKEMGITDHGRGAPKPKMTKKIFDPPRYERCPNCGVTLHRLSYAPKRASQTATMQYGNGANRVPGWGSP